MHFASEKDNSIKNLLGLADAYPAESERAVFAGQADSIIAELIALIEKRQEPCILASKMESI